MTRLRLSSCMRPVIEYESGRHNSDIANLSRNHLKLKICAIELACDNSVQLLDHSQILHRAWQYDCNALYKCSQ